MASTTQTPRQRLQRPSYGNVNSAEKQSSLSASTAVNRKGSSRALSGDPHTRTPSASKMDVSDLEVGDAVNVPGDMYGTVKFIGSVRGKNGQFVGVELGREFAARGKNDGDVDGVQYFKTSVPGAGIFLPIHRAEKRLSPTASPDTFPPTPGTPSHSTLNGHRTKGNNARTPPTPAVTLKFSQSVGPGARPMSPMFKPKRPSMARPESPFRKQPPNLAPTPGRTLSQSTRGGRPPGLSSTTTPNKNSLRASTTTRPQPSQTPRPYSRTGSRMGNRPETVPESGRPSTLNGRTTSSGSVPSFSQPLRSPSRLGSAGSQDAEIQRLKKEVAERDRRLDEQAASLAEMESSLKELSALMPADGPPPSGSNKEGDEDEQTAAQLRQTVREKNEKISLLTQEFDSHRADFRSTLDSLEMASTETERVYEEQKRDLLAQIAELQELSQSKEDFEGVARQLKQLEELVQELEEGLEESRRGEAEARGEVEFLRGEVERGRSELRREREKAAAVVQKGAETGGVVSAKELEQRDDEIRGLKAIIHNLSSTPNGTSAEVNGDYTSNSEELEKLQGALDASRREKDDLEHELEQLRRDTAVPNVNGSEQPSNPARHESERTAKASERDIPIRTRSGTIKPTFAEHALRSGLDEEAEHEEGEVNGESVYCEMCESKEHDTLECTKFQSLSSETKHAVRSVNGDDDGADEEDEETTAAPEPKEKAADVVETGAAEEEDKWCALCEKDGHLAFDCPEEQY